VIQVDSIVIMAGLLRNIKFASNLQWTRSIKTFTISDLKTQVSKFKESPITNNATFQEVLNRVQVVNSVSDSIDIINDVMSMGQPVGVDMEGVVDGVTSMVQVRDVEKNIFLFRTGANPSLFKEGGVARLLEDPNILKIMHGASVDCLSAYKDGVKLWNLFDTSVAFKVMEFQLKGTSINSSNQIGFNAICQHFNIQENPVKDRFKNILWKMILTKDGHRGIDTAEILDDEVLLYCAWDVDPLHKIHEELTSVIAPSFTNLVTQLSEIEIFRAIDPPLAKMKRKSLKSMESCSAFVKGLSPSTSLPDLYISVNSFPGNKHIYHSRNDGTAVVMFDSREIAVEAVSNTTDWFQKLGSTGHHCKLVVNQHDNEVLIPEMDGQNEVVDDCEVVTPEDNKSSRNRITTETCLNLMNTLLSAKCPVVIVFVLLGDESEVEIFTGVAPTIKISITEELVKKGGLGDFLSSDVIKILPRIDVNSVHSALKRLKDYGIHLNNVIDINSNVKALDYLDHGQSLFKQKSMNVQEMSRRLSIPVTDSKIQWHYMAYMYLKDKIPVHFKKVLKELSIVELDVASNDANADAKARRKSLKNQVDSNCVHLRLIGDYDVKRREKMKSVLKYILLNNDLTLEEYYDLGRCAIVQLATTSEARILMEELEKVTMSPFARFVPSWPKDFKQSLEKPAKTDVHLATLEKEVDRNVKVLRTCGLSESYLF